MMFAALLSIMLVFVTILLTVEARVRQQLPEVTRVQRFFAEVAKICTDRPDLLKDCPSFISDGRPRANNPAQNRGGVIDLYDPRPWVVPMLIASTVLAALLALSAALLVGRRIAQPIEAVSKAAQLLAGGQLSARVATRERSSNGDETAQLALSFNRMAQSLEANELERRQLIADIAHELRTPLAVMISRLEALEDGVFELDQSEVKRLQMQANFLARLVEDLRIVSLAEAGRLSLQRRTVDLRGLTLETVSGFQARAAQVSKEIRVLTEPVSISADPDRLRQVLTNLLENALKYASSEVRLGLSVHQSEARIVIADDGDGLPPSELTRVFDRFYRSDSSRNRSSGGSGLGLSIVKAIVELHGGRVSARNLEPRGAEFTVVLPLRV